MDNRTASYSLEPEEKKMSTGAAVAAGAGVGAVAGAAAAGAAAYASRPEEPVVPIEPIEPDNVNEQGIQFATVNADSFNEAFAQARAQVGPGGAFEWHGQIYGTYYETEWNAMSDAEKEAFTANAMGYAHHDGGHHGGGHDNVIYQTNVIIHEPNEIHRVGTMDGLMGQLGTEEIEPLLYEPDDDDIVPFAGPSEEDPCYGMPSPDATDDYFNEGHYYDDNYDA